MIEAVLIDSREPQWVKSLTFDGVPVSVIELNTGDIQVVTDDGCLLNIERKQSDDLLNSLREERLFPQMVRLAEARLAQNVNGEQLTHWPYLVITDALHPSANGKTITARGETGWSWPAVQGALLNIQEMGVFIAQCASDREFESCVKSLANRARDPLQKILPPRPGIMLGPGTAFLASLPGIGPEKAVELMRWSANTPAHALAGITDLEIEAPIGESLRKRIRHTLGLRDQQMLATWINQQDDEVLKVLEKQEK